MFLADFHQGLVAVGLAALKQLQRKGCIGQALAGPLRCKLGTPKEIICLQIISNLCALHVDRTSLFPLFRPCSYPLQPRGSFGQSILRMEKNYESVFHVELRT